MEIFYAPCSVVHGFRRRRIRLRLETLAMRSGDVPPYFSLHEGALLDLIALARRVSECPECLIIFGIQPETIAPGETVSSVLQARLPEYLGEIGKGLSICSGSQETVVKRQNETTS